jgi:RimJ/RimL family protein N-acetyltransferase
VLAFNGLELAAVGAKHRLDNPASGRVLAKTGFALVGESDGFAHYCKPAISRTCPAGTRPPAAG